MRIVLVNKIKYDTKTSGNTKIDINKKLSKTL